MQSSPPKTGNEKGSTIERAASRTSAESSIESRRVDVTSRRRRKTERDLYRRQSRTTDSPMENSSSTDLEHKRRNNIDDEPSPAARCGIVRETNGSRCVRTSSRSNATRVKGLDVIPLAFLARHDIARVHTERA
ncbi:hypothetical protein HN011_010362 [Eciton burchellii]|nr:hypothetical protein HN011_010362 [Eciton burchellii]